MKKPNTFAAGLALAALALSVGVSTAEASYRDEALKRLGQLETKFVGLAEKTPAAKFTYRPGDGVRSTSEVFLHVSSANYGIARTFGAQPPAGLDLRGLEKSTTDQAKIVAALKGSFAHMRGAIEKLGDGDGDKATKMFGQDTTQRGAVQIMLEHLSEHLGQAIAYARVSGVTPPWSE